MPIVNTDRQTKHSVYKINPRVSILQMKSQFCPKDPANEKSKLTMDGTELPKKNFGYKDPANEK